MIGEMFYLELCVYGVNGILGDWCYLKVYGGGMVFDWGVYLFD